MLTDTEQLFLELLNAARLDPEGEAARQGTALGAGLDPGAISGDPVQPLAPNARLQQAAADHGRWVLAQDSFAHTGVGGSLPGARMAAAGYEFGARQIWGENLAALGTEGTIDPAAAIDTGIHGFKGHFDALYQSPGHRATMFLPEFRETGVSQEFGSLTFEPGTLDTSMLTNTFATPGEGVFLTGVVYDDPDRNGYTVGDGVAGVTISDGGATTATRGAGGYTLDLAGGASVDVTLGSSTDAMRVSVDMSGDNVKLDLVDGNHILTSGDIVLGTGAQSVEMLGAVDSTATGNGDDNVFHVGRGDNTLLGGGGADRAVFTGARADYEIDPSDPGRIPISDRRTGPDGDGLNTLGEIEFADFTDTSLSFLTLRLSTLDGTPGRDTPLTFSLPDGSTRSLATDPAGAVALSVPEGMTGRLDMAAGAGDPAALEVGDALDVLRLAVGLEPSFGPATPFDLVAADVDRSGHVGVDDALGVLRAAVGLDAPGAEPGAFVLIDPAAPPTGRAPDSVTFTSGADIPYSLAAGTLDLQMLTLGDLGAAAAV